MSSLRQATVRISILLTLALSILLGGCTSPKRWFTNKSTVRDALVKLPNDGAIYVEIEQTEGLGQRERQLARYVWEQPGRQIKVLTVSGNSAPPAALDRASCTSHLSVDGNTADLLSKGRVVATFDYQAGTATFPP